MRFTKEKGRSPALPRKSPKRYRFGLSLLRTGCAAHSRKRRARLPSAIVTIHHKTCRCKFFSRWALIRSPGRRTPFQRRGRAAARRETRGKISARRAVTSQPFRLNDLVNLGNLHKLRPFSRFRFPVPRSRFSPLPVWSSLALFSACETFHERKCFCKSATYVKRP